MKKPWYIAVMGIVIPALIIGCSGTTNGADSAETARVALQSSYSHSNSTEPDYSVVLPDDKVNEITITISPDNWQAVLDDMTSNYGEFGKGQGMGGGGRGGGQPGGGPGAGQPQAQADAAGNDQGNSIQNATPPADVQAMPTPQANMATPEAQGQRQNGPQGNNNNQNRPQMGGGAGDPGGGGGGGGMDGAIMDEEDNPVWVDSTVSFNGETWEHVGFRLKGNSSLRSSWTSGNYKLPFRLDFDQFEDDYPATRNQRFYGFKKLTFSSNFSDSSYLRETVAADIFRAAGVPAAHTAFYAVYIDYGDGPVYFGLYTAVEAVDDTLIQTQFTNDSGNVYKPSGSAATFKAGTFNEEQYAKKTNEKDADYSDVKALMETLNDSSRQTDPEKWRSNLEKVFDVDDFLKWLAANSIMSNWDTYGSMAHNYYLYHDSTSGELVWIPWDNNQSISSRGNGGGGNANNGGNNAKGGGGGGGGGPMGQSSSSIGNESAGDNWPLISYLMADEVYHAQYVKTVKEVLNNAFDLVSLDKEITAKHDLIASYVESEKDGYTTLSDKSSFETSAQALIETLQTRYQVAQEYLAENQ